MAKISQVPYGNAKLKSESLDICRRQPCGEERRSQFVPHLLGLGGENSSKFFALLYRYRGQINGRTSFEIWGQIFP